MLLGRRCGRVTDVLVSLAEGPPGRADLARHRAITLQAGSHTSGPGTRSGPLLAIAAGQAARNGLCRPPAPPPALLTLRRPPSRRRRWELQTGWCGAVVPSTQRHVAVPAVLAHREHRRAPLAVQFAARDRHIGRCDAVH